jgi:hypothetical protein
VVLLEYLGREDEFVDGLLSHGVFATIVEQINRERAFHFDRSLAVLIVEHESSAKAPFRRLPRLVQDVVRPDVDDFVGDLRLVLGVRPFHPLG